MWNFTFVCIGPLTQGPVIVPCLYLAFRTGVCIWLGFGFRSAVVLIAVTYLSSDFIVLSPWHELSFCLCLRG